MLLHIQTNPLCLSKGPRRGLKNIVKAAVATGHITKLPQLSFLNAYLLAMHQPTAHPFKERRLAASFVGSLWTMKSLILRLGVGKWGKFNSCHIPKGYYEKYASDKTAGKCCRQKYAPSVSWTALASGCFVSSLYEQVGEAVYACEKVVCQLPG